MVYGYGNKMIKFFMSITNFGILLFGGLVFAFSLWANLDQDFATHLRVFAQQVKIDGNFVNELAAYQASLWILVAVGALLFIVGFLGYCGAACENMILLTLYFIIISILALIELFVITLMFTHRGELLDSVHRAFVESAQTAEGRLNLRPIQTALNCCGATIETQYLYTKEGLCPGQLSTADDCYSVLAYKISSDAVFVSAILLLLVQIFAMIFSCVLCRAFRERGPVYYA